MAKSAYRFEMLAPGGSSPTTQQLLRAPVITLAGREPLGNHLASLLVRPFDGTPFPFGVAGIGWCRDKRVAQELLVLVAESVRVTALSGDPTQLTAWGDTFTDPAPGAFAVAFAGPASDVPGHPEDEEVPMPLATQQAFSKTFEFFYWHIMEASLKVDPSVIILAAAAEDAAVADAKVREATQRLWAQFQR